MYTYDSLPNSPQNIVAQQQAQQPNQFHTAIMNRLNQIVGSASNLTAAYQVAGHNAQQGALDNVNKTVADSLAKSQSAVQQQQAKQKANYQSALDNNQQMIAQQQQAQAAKAAQLLAAQQQAISGLSSTLAGRTSGGGAAPTSARSNGGAPAAASSAPVGGDLGSFLNSIAKQESGGNYKAVNKSSGALGKYQVMPANVASWTKAALGHSVSTSEYLNSPDIQEAVAKTILGGYYSKYGPTGAAIAWYSGEGNAKKFAQTGKISQRIQGAYPSIANYAKSVTGRL